MFNSGTAFQANFVRPENANIVLKSSLNRFKGLNISFMNIRSLKPKHDQILQLVNDVNLDIMCFAETWLRDHIPDASISIPGYNLFRSDRKSLINSRGGGVCAYVRSSIKTKIIELFFRDYIEVMLLELDVGLHKILLGIVYKPPEVSFNADLESLLNKYALNYTDVILCGDFNCDVLKPGRQTKEFLNMVKRFSISCINSEPTHFSKTSCSTIDLVLTNRSNKVLFFNQLSLGFTDHDLLFFCYESCVNKTSETFSYYDYKAVNLNKLNAECLMIPWIDWMKLTDTEIMMETFNEYISKLFTGNVPYRTKRIRLNKPPWFNAEIEQDIALRDFIFHKWKLSKSTVDRKEFKRIRNLITSKIRLSKSSYYNNVLKPSDSPKNFWKKIKELGVGKSAGEKTEIDPNEFGSHLAAATKTKGLIFNVPSSGESHEDRLYFDNIGFVEISRAFYSVKSNATGLDEIPIKFLKLLLPMIPDVFLHIFNQLITKSEFPNAWKIAKVIPLNKIKDPQKLSDFRPISVLPAISKVFEKIIKDQICSHLNCHKLLFCKQSAYRSGCSTTTAILDIIDDFKREIDKKRSGILVLLDFSNAFDSIDHAKLINKLVFNFKFSTSSANLIKSYLVGRSQYVYSNNSISSAFKIYSGVPQGSVLGPILFSLYINDLPQVVKYCHSHLFADDYQLYRFAKINEMTECVTKINLDITSIADWSLNNDLRINAIKTQCIVISTNDVDLNFIPPVCVKSIPIVYSEVVKDLGLLIDRKLSWENHVNSICKKVNFMLRTLWTTARDLDPDHKRKLFFAFLLPHLIYCDSSFYGMQKMHFSKLELLLNNCVRYVYGLRKYDHVTEFRRKMLGCDLHDFYDYRACLQVFKLTKEHEPLYLYSKLQCLKSTRTNNILVPINYGNIFNSSFFVRGISLWNSLPLQVKQSASLAAFRQNYAQHFSIFQHDV